MALSAECENRLLRALGASVGEETLAAINAAVKVSESPTITGSPTHTGAETFALGTGQLMPIIGTVNSQQSIAGVGNGNDTTADTLFTFTLPPNCLLAANGLRLSAWGVFGATANHKQVTLNFGNTTVASTGNITANGTAWKVEALVLAANGTAQDAFGQTNAGGTMTATHSQPTETATGNITLKVSGASLTGGVVNDVVANGFLVEGIN